MTNRPTDDFDDLAEDQVELNNPSEDDAAFGRATDDDLSADDAVADDSDFVADDMADVSDELSDDERLDSDEADYTDEDNFENAEDEGVEYDIVEGEEPAANPRDNRKTKNADGKLYFGKYKKSDLIFYGIMGVGGVIALVFLLNFIMDDGAQPQQQPITLSDTTTIPDNTSAQPQQQAAISGMMVPNNNEIPAVKDLPASAPEPTPDGIGVPGALSTLKDDSGTMPAPLTATTDNQPAVAEQQAPAAPTPAPAQPAAPEEPLAPVAQVTAPPSLGVDNTALAERMSEMSVKLAELNAQLAQINDSIGSLQKTTEKLDKQNQDLAVKTTDLGTRLDQQNSKVDAQLEESAKQRDAMLKDIKSAQEKTRKDAGTTGISPAALDELKISVAQLERRMASLGKTQGGSQSSTPATEKAPVARQPQSFDGPPPPAATPVKSAKKPANDTVEIPAPPQRRASMPDTQVAPQSDYQQDTYQAPRSPKSRDQAGMLNTYEKPSWVLRAATPNMAWLSPRAGSAELRRVAVGDTVDGIGQVRDIRQEAGRWVVVGTESTVR